ncbi:MAG: 3-dehydroquinate synthase [Clostridia bacterium]|nr:3-dehydroquinate synthase [Clostridia bacterium]
MEKVRVTASKEYNVHIGSDFLDSVGEMVANLKRPCRAVIVSDDNVYSLYGEKVKSSLEKSGFTVFEYIVLHGENSKSVENFIKIQEFCAENNITRTDLFVALGGGVVGDLTGFVASTYLRGVDFVQIPTTVLAMVDSSVGGKTAINLNAGKNLCGAFHQPVAVFADCITLDTLPEETFNEGCAEIIKYGMILDGEFLSFLKDNEIRENIEYVIKRCVEIKRDIVDHDEFEKGERKLLNFGHTIGHAIEKCSGYKISHGNAVAIGMVIATKGAFELGLSYDDYSDELLPILKKNNLPTACDFSADELYKVTLTDKKRSRDVISLIVPEEYGLCKIHKINIDQLKDFIESGLN